MGNSPGSLRSPNIFSPTSRTKEPLAPSICYLFNLIDLKLNNFSLEKKTNAKEKENSTRVIYDLDLFFRPAKFKAIPMGEMVYIAWVGPEREGVGVG